MAVGKETPGVVGGPRGPPTVRRDARNREQVQEGSTRGGDNRGHNTRNQPQTLTNRGPSFIEAYWEMGAGLVSPTSGHSTTTVSRKVWSGAWVSSKGRLYSS